MICNLLKAFDYGAVRFEADLGRNLFNHLTSTLVLRGKGDVLCHEMLRNYMFLYANNKLIRRELLNTEHVTFDESMSYADIQWAFSANTAGTSDSICFC